MNQLLDPTLGYLPGIVASVGVILLWIFASSDGKSGCIFFFAGLLLFLGGFIWLLVITGMIGIIIVIAFVASVAFANSRRN